MFLVIFWVIFRREKVHEGALFSSVLDTQLYIFARQCQLYLDMKRPADVAKVCHAVHTTTCYKYSYMKYLYLLCCRAIHSRICSCT